MVLIDNWSYRMPITLSSKNCNGFVYQIFFVVLMLSHLVAMSTRRSYATLYSNCYTLSFFFIFNDTEDRLFAYY